MILEIVEELKIKQVPGMPGVEVPCIQGILTNASGVPSKVTEIQCFPPRGSPYPLDKGLRYEVEVKIEPGLTILKNIIGPVKS